MILLYSCNSVRYSMFDAERIPQSRFHQFKCKLYLKIHGFSVLCFVLAETCLSDPDLREKLMDLYLALSCYPEVPRVLKTLRDGGLRTAILSNGSREMLDSAVANSKLGDCLDAVLSADDVGAAVSGLLAPWLGPENG